MADHEDRHAAMMIAAPVVDLLGGAPPDQYRTGGITLGDEMSAPAGALAVGQISTERRTSRAGA